MAAMRPRFAGLWRHPDFLKLWAGETISLVGSQLTLLALPLTAALVLDATPVEMGLLGALGSMPYLLFGLFAGVWVDRLRRRPIMIVANLGRAALLASIPVTALLGALRLEQLYLVAFGAGVLSVFFGVAYGSFLPSVVRREDLVEGNAKLAVSEAVARVAGPGLAGGLVHLVTAPIAIAADAASFLVSALFLARIRAAEPLPVSGARRDGVWGEIGEGLRLVAGHSLLRPLIGSAGLGNLGDGLLANSGVYILYMTRELGIEPAALGVILSGLGIGGLVGAGLAGPLTRRFGIGPTSLGGRALWGASFLAISLVGGPPALAAALLAAALALVGLVNPIAGATAASLRQAVTPSHLLGRMTATVQFTLWGGVTIGALVGGALAEAVGPRPTVALAALLPSLGFLWLLLSPVRSLREVPAPPRDPSPNLA